MPVRPSHPFSRPVVLVLLIGLLVACSERGGHSDPPQIIESNSPAYDKNAPVAPAVSSNNTLACAIYKELSSQAETSDNLFFSPLSISSALMLVYEGTRGETREQFDTLMGFHGKDSVDIHRAYARTVGGLAPDPQDPSYQLEVANALWGEQTMPFSQAYLDTLKKHYEASFASADFKNDPKGQRDRINRWVSKKTQGRIDGVLSEDAVTKYTRLVLANALYFKGRWSSEFSKRVTKDEPFYLMSGQSVDVPTMHKREANFMHGDFDGYDALMLWYESSGLHMVVLLPDQKDGLPALEKRLSPSLLEETVKRMDHKVVNLWLPKWETTEQADLSTVLTKLGLKDAFDDQRADFSGISDSSGEPLFLSGVNHKAFIAVDEEGTEAAAVTAIVVQAAGELLEEKSKPIEFRADHPFVYVIRDSKTGAILFMGRVSDPS